MLAVSSSSGVGPSLTSSIEFLDDGRRLEVAVVATGSGTGRINASSCGLGGWRTTVVDEPEPLLKRVDISGKNVTKELIDELEG